MPSEDLGFELPPEAMKLIETVERLGEAAAGSREQAEDELAKVRRRAEQEMSVLKHELRDEQAILDRRRLELERDQKAFDAMVRDRLEGAGFLAEAWADYENARAGAQAEELRAKSHPAYAAAEAVAAKGNELSEARREAKLAQFRVEFYEWNFPWLSDLLDQEEASDYVGGGDGGDAQTTREHDPAAGWLSKEEWQALPPAERNQRALERYLRSRKSNWQLGRDYERYIGYLREQAGCRVSYEGIFKGFEDLGRDVLAEKDGKLEVVQCKRWSQRKTIHEKHIFQLYGTMVLAGLERPAVAVSGTFTTTTKLSEKAREVAEFLQVRVEENIPLADYPRIKCNISRQGDRIYHLPFDQQYDSTLIEPARGELYAVTCPEAEELGFRRAWRWRGTD